MADFIKSTRKPAGGGGGGHDAHGGPSGMTSLAISLQKVNIPPMITFDEDFGGRRISWLFLAMGGLIVGMLAAIMGVGGGFVTFPMFVYIFCVSTATTVGTDILQIIFTAGLAAIAQYAIYGYVFYTLAMGMLIGSLIGIQVGALTTPVIAEAALIRALLEEKIRGAALDVFATEPLPEGHPFYRMENVLLSPHCADHTPRSLWNAMELFADNLERFRRAEPLLNVIGKRRGY